MIGGRPRAAWGLGVVGGVLAMAALAAPAAAATPPTTDPATTPSGPSLEVVDQAFPDDAVASATTFKVQGAGWPADVLIQLEVCGAEARSGTSDCALDTAQVVASNSHGTFEGRLQLVIPPSPCPCVVRAVSESTSDAATAPLDIPQAPTAHPGDGDVSAPALRRLDAEHVELEGSDDVRTWLGGKPQRTFVFELVNTGSVAVENATVTMTAGPADDPTGFVTPVRVDRMDVGERRSFSVPIEFPNLSYGDQAVRATVNGTAVPVTFSATTTTHPWILIIVPALLLLQFLLLAIRNLVRRWLHRNDVAAAPFVDPDAPADDSLICVVEVIDTFAADDTGDTGDTADTEGAGGTVGPHHQTLVVRSIAAVQQMVLDSLRVDADGRPDPPPGPERIITTITVLADADARVGAAYHGCDVLCTWIETTFAESTHPDARRLTLRRHVSAGTTNASAASGLGMVPLSVLVRAPHVRAVA